VLGTLSLVHITRSELDSSYEHSGNVHIVPTGVRELDLAHGLFQRGWCNWVD